MPIPYPVEEKKRLAFLHSLGLLDTAPDPAFDRVTRLASKLLDVPVSLVSLVDENRQWFKSKVGLEVSQTPREDAFCSYTIMEEDSLVVSDATNDARFARNPLVLHDPNIRFYAGVPIRGTQGLAIGSLCVIDSKPKTLKPEELAVLHDLASIVTKEIQLLEGLLDTHDRLARTDAQLADNEQRFRSVFELAKVGIALINPQGRWLRVNDALCGIVGYTEAELLPLTFQDITRPDDLHTDLQLLQQLVDDKIPQYQLEKRYIRKDQQQVWINLTVSKKLDQQGQLEYFIAVVQDIDAEKKAQLELAAMHQQLEQKVVERTRELRKRESELTAVLENASDAFISLDGAGCVTGWNREAEVVFGWLATEALGKPLEHLLIPGGLDGPYGQQWRTYLLDGMRSVVVRRSDLMARRKDCTELAVEVRMRTLLINDMRSSIMFLHDISERKQTEAMRDYEIQHDALTGLLNRRALTDILPLAQERARRNGNPLCLLFIDLDGFKKVNDMHGHEAGDVLLQTVAARIRDSIRLTDSAFRLAGDEFVVLLEGPNGSLEHARTRGEKLIAAISETVPLPGGLRTANVGASIGIALQEAGVDKDPADLIKEADAQMYRAKSLGKGTICY
ncbi:diguanylate cyclase [Herbaspirillum sp. LeCh32-8]|uniref:diguanylate cyclase domain-containing protein n=1 Tax=Herbaspirillum sp. LeCh32-8 TaxID=2821356 RepID=UPI001AE79829|nr:diguanylate cyclase [Herbaspirillum sp. LeCh32-8]MBP0600014.1 diguanylate cyclase [Herbaspirillum sp. LeCh32-8]